jgi:hypothetical protein
MENQEIQVTGHVGRDLNPRCSEYEQEMSLTRLLRSVTLLLHHPLK